ncbi:MAG: hypothetical protein QOG05_1445 [Streptosporangiaceae bacterium]|jgi:hypothetical protein|nr:hypothetical protein [Streptosporangiaceae bacterium]
MRRRITRTLFAAAAAGVTASTLGLSAVGAANAAVATKAQPATIGTTIATTSTAGYEASGRDFRYISSTLTVPDTSFLTGIYPQEYIQLSNGSLTQPTGGGDQYIRAGIEACVVARSFGDTCPTGTWVAFVEAFDNSLSGPYFSHFYNLAGVNQGDGVNFSIYYDEAGNELHFVITPPSTSGTPQYYKTQAYGAIFDHAAALDDFTDSTGTPIPLPFFIHAFRINQFLQGAITTEHGLRGSFVGPWTTSPVEATSNGLPFPSGHVRVSPNALWSDGLVANGAVRANDAFGVWAR